MAKVLQTENTFKGAGADGPVRPPPPTPTPPAVNRPTPTTPTPGAPITSDYVLSSTDQPAETAPVRARPKTKPQRPRPPSVADLESAGIRRPAVDTALAEDGGGNPFAAELAASDELVSPPADTTAVSLNPFDALSAPPSPPNPFIVGVGADQPPLSPNPFDVPVSADDGFE